VQGIRLGHRRALCDEFVIMNNINHNEWCVEILLQVVVPRFVYNFFMLSNYGILLLIIIYSNTCAVPQIFTMLCVDYIIYIELPSQI